MPRQRLHLESSSLADAVGRGLVALAGAAIAWYGLMTVLLAFKVSPATVNDISGYRTAFDYLAALGHPDVVGARARHDDDRIELAITARTATSLVETLQEVEERAFKSLETHQLHAAHVDVTLAGYDSPKGRELQ